MIRNRLLGSVRLPGMIEISRAPDGPAGGGGTEPGGGGSSTTPASPSSNPASSSSPSGATSSPAAPAAAPQSSGGGTPPTSASATPEPLPEDLFSGFGASDDEEGDTAPESEPAETPAAPVAATPPQAPTPEAQTPPAAAQPGGEQPPAPSAQPGQDGVTPRLPTPAEPAAMGGAILQNLDALADELAKSPEFTLSEADIEAINTDFAGALPKFAARVFLRAQAGALSQMERVIPAMVQKYLKASEAQNKSKGAFYTRWPQIKEVEHGAIVDRLAATYRKENPAATREQMIEDLGPYVMMVAKIPLNQAAPQAPGTNGQRPRVPPSPPFTPAVGGPASIPEAPDENPWVGYGAPTDE